MDERKFPPEFRGGHPREEFRLRDVDLGHLVIDRRVRPIVLVVLAVVIFTFPALIHRQGTTSQTWRSAK